MFNQYNFYPGFVPPFEWQLEQLRNQNINYQEYIQNIYYIQNQYTVFPPNDNEMLEEKTFTNLQEHINNIYKRGIANNIIGAFFIEECKEMKVGFVGSVAYHFQNVLKECLAEYSLAIGEVMQAPAEGLIRYYQNLPA